MNVFIKRNIVRFILTIFFVTAISFLLIKISPVDPAKAYAMRAHIYSDSKIEAIREDMGLKKPVAYQYLHWLKNAAHGDFGKSLVTSMDVFSEMKRSFAYTGKIVILSIFIQGIGAVFFAVTRYLNRNNLVGKAIEKLCVLTIAVPTFIMAGIIMEIFANQLHLIKLSNNEGLARYLPAAISLSLNGIAYFTKLLCDAIDKQMNENNSFYVKALGLSDWQILKKYTLSQSGLSILPTFLQMMGMCFAGSLIVEQVFGLPGIGALLLNSVLMRDAPMIHGIVFLMGVIIAIFSLIADISRKAGARNEA